MIGLRNAKWYDNVVYNWEQKSNRIYSSGISIFTVLLCTVAYVLTGKLEVFLGLPVGVGAGFSIYLRLFIVPISVRISPNSLHFRHRIGPPVKTFLWRDILEIRFKDGKGDPLMPHQWKIFNVYLSGDRKTKHGINVSDEIFELIRRSSKKYNPNIIWNETGS